MNLPEILTLLLGTAMLLLVLTFVIYSIENTRRARYSTTSLLVTLGAICFLIAVAVMGVSTLLQPLDILVQTAVILWMTGALLLLVGQTLQIKAFKKIYGSLRSAIGLSSSRWSLAGIITLILGTPVYLSALNTTVNEGFTWYSAVSIVIWVFVFACLTVAERKLFLISSTSPPEASITKLVQDDAQTLVAYSSLTNRFLAHVVPVIGVSGLEDALAPCVEEHPILFDDKLIDGGVLNVDQLIKNSRRIHESERISEIFSAFSDLNTTIVDLYAAFTSPAQAAYMVGIEAELYRDEVALWMLGVPLGKYSEAVYEREIIIGLPDGVADVDKAKNFAYLLFKRYLERLLNMCKKSTRASIKRELSEMARKNPALGRVDLSEDGKIDLSRLYQHLSGTKFKDGMRELVETFSTFANICYEAAKRDLGTKQATEIASEVFSELLRKYGGFLQHYGITEAIPEGVQIRGTYLPLVAGKSYLVEGRSPRQAFKMFADLVRYGNTGLVITTSHPAHVRKEYSIPDRITVLWLSKVEVDYAVSPSNLGILRDRITAFASKRENAVILLEGLEYLITTNGFDLTLKLMHDIREIVVINRARLIVPVAPMALETKQLEMLRRYMEVVETEEE